MRFRSNASDSKKAKPNVDLTPTIDVVFQLILFFMLSSTFVVQTSIPIEVAEAEGSTQLEQKELSITLSYEQGGPDNLGKIFVNDVEIFEWDELTKTLVALKEREKDALVLIRPDARIPTERLIKVLGLTSSAGIERYGIAAQPPQDEKEK